MKGRNSRNRQNDFGSGWLKSYRQWKNLNATFRSSNTMQGRASEIIQGESQMCNHSQTKDEDVNAIDGRSVGLLCAQGSLPDSKYQARAQETANQLSPHAVEGTEAVDTSCSNVQLSLVPTTPYCSSMVLGDSRDIIQIEDFLCKGQAFSRDTKMAAVDVMKPAEGPKNVYISSSDISTVHSSPRYSKSGHAGSSANGNCRNSLSHIADDDWEAVADAIYMAGSTFKMASPFASEVIRMVDLPKRNKKLSAAAGKTNCPLKPGHEFKTSVVRGCFSVEGKAWRPDDEARPPTLPTVSKQQSFPFTSTAPVWSELDGGTLWGPPAPLCCPICTEELDVTDSSFVPCSCGFRLCLFCHHRIASDGGRCPGCRKPYNFDLAMQLSHACGVWLQI